MKSEQEEILKIIEERQKILLDEAEKVEIIEGPNTRLAEFLHCRHSECAYIKDMVVLLLLK